MTPFQVYQTYQSLKQHFSRWDYDCFKYNFKTNCRIDSFEKRRDRYQFRKLSITCPDPLGFMVSNIMERDVSWVGDLLSDEAESTYLRWLKRQQSLTYIFTNEVDRLEEPFNSNFTVVDGGYPILYKMYKRGDVSPETVVILEDLLGFFGHWKREVKDQTIWPGHHLKLVKYKPFVKYDFDKCKKILQASVNRV